MRDRGRQYRPLINVPHLHIDFLKTKLRCSFSLISLFLKSWSELIEILRNFLVVRCDLKQFDFKLVEPKLMRSSVGIQMEREDHRRMRHVPQSSLRESTLRRFVPTSNRSCSSRAIGCFKSRDKISFVWFYVARRRSCQWQKYLGQEDEDNNRLTLLWRRWMPGPQMELHGVHLDQGDIWQSIGHATSQYLVS